MTTKHPTVNNELINMNEENNSSGDLESIVEDQSLTNRKKKSSHEALEVQTKTSL